MKCKKQKDRRDHDVQNKVIKRIKNGTVNKIMDEFGVPRGTGEEGGGEKCGCGMDKAFPMWTPYGVLALTLAIRLYHVSCKANWWILHPDEIFQSVEVAFSEVYGYGFRPYEYLPPPTNVTSPAEEQEMENGMYSLRSFLYPRIFMVAFGIARWIGIGEKPFLIGKIFHAAVTSLLPVSVYRFVRQTHGCHCLSSIACVAVASSLHLTILGTHTLVNSFLSPVFFFAMSLLSPALVHTNDIKPIDRRAGGEIVGGQSVKHDASCKTGKGVVYSDNIQCHNNANMESKTELPVSTGKVEYYLKHLLCGFMLGVVCYIRIDMCITLALISMSLVLTFSTVRDAFSCFEEISASGVGLLFALTLGGYEDHSRYGLWFLSPIQWLKFNFITDLSATLYGLQSPWMYVEEIFLEGSFIAVLYFVSAFVLIFNIVKKEEKLAIDLQLTLSMVLSSGALFLVYSRVGHKEVRFLHDFIVLQIIVVSSAGHLILHRLGPIFNKRTSFIIYAILSCHVINTLYQFPNHSTETRKKWAYKSNTISADLNACIDFVSSREDVRGVLIDGSIYATGGFSLLRKDIPILIRIHHEYHEYGKKSIALRNRHGLEHSSQLRVVSRLTDFVDISNVLYLKKILLERNEYNYLVVKNADVEKYSVLGYEREYSVGHFTVLARDVSKKEQLELLKLGNDMPVGSNSTVLEYEGSWLFTSGVYTKAIERLERALEIDDSRIRPFQLLGLSYIRSNRWAEAEGTERRCFERHGEKACLQPQQRVVLRTGKTGHTNIE
ncbi:hypothetical protein ScPMuIL_005998 [Solemya velum]